MPGMMDTVLNVGMTETVAEALTDRCGGGLFGWDTARRFVQSYASVATGAPAELVGRLSAQCLGSDDGRSLSPQGSGCSDTTAPSRARGRRTLHT